MALACACSCALAQEQQQDQPQDQLQDQLQQPAAVAAAELAGPPVPESAAPLGVVKRLETGIASWYGKQFHGRKTANGERFDMDALTAAHPKLPFGSWVRVRDLVSGRSVDVRINDRGPHIKQRVIDLSRAAARALGLGGTHQVELTLLDKHPR
ncbi:septal ring lytic transglycosylase RlpA family protein [Caenimonas terrae]|uniref:Endolytic peptidoglycan transglycosylase RlpA n=1 Tax=Caenimonas terrae TaxID=696074 RepID=A0ABW0NJZ6_9BURK